MRQQGRRWRNAFHLICVLSAFSPDLVEASLPPHDAADSSDYIFVDSFESSDCSQPLTCATPQAGKACLAGQLRDAATTQPMHATFNVGLACTSGANGAIGGPCDLALTAYDALQYAADPVGAMPLANGGTIVDGCGRFRVSDLTPSGTGFVAIVASDAPRNAGHTPTATPHAAGSGQAFDGITAAVAGSDTVALWSTQAQADFTSLGALLLSYSTNGMPTPGVTVFGSAGAPGTICYFTDTDPQRLSASSVATSTGANGSALATNAPLGTYSGLGGESGGCHWTGVPSASVPGVIFYAELACVP